MAQSNPQIPWFLTWSYHIISRPQAYNAAKVTCATFSRSDSTAKLPSCGSHNTQVASDGGRLNSSLVHNFSILECLIISLGSQQSSTFIEFWKTFFNNHISSDIFQPLFFGRNTSGSHSWALACTQWIGMANSAWSESRTSNQQNCWWADGSFTFWCYWCEIWWNHPSFRNSSILETWLLKTTKKPATIHGPDPSAIHGSLGVRWESLNGPINYGKKSCKNNYTCPKGPRKDTHNNVCQCFSRLRSNHIGKWFGFQHNRTTPCDQKAKIIGASRWCDNKLHQISKRHQPGQLNLTWKMPDPKAVLWGAPKPPSITGKRSTIFERPRSSQVQ